MRRIDVHCHFFNRKELSALMLLNIIHMIRNAEISLSGTNSNQNVNEARQISKSVKSSISFFMTSLKSSKQIFKKINGYEKGYIFAPLMLDAYWLTQSPKTNDPHVRQDDIMEVVKNELDNISDSMQNITKRKSISTEKRHLSIEMRRITDSFRRLLNKKTFEDVPKLNSSVDNFPKQEAEIVALQTAYPDDIMPFYAVDPRRASNFVKKADGSYDITPITDKLKINGGHFTGFKLYTPCGYSPTHPMLMKMYEYCEQNNVPIIAHVSGSGATTLANKLYIEGHVYKDQKIHEVNQVWEFDNKNLFARDRILEHSERLNHPMLWEYILNKYPKLKIDLAHFGHLPHSMEWTNYIWGMMKKKDKDGAWAYPNLYTDLACIPDRDTLFTFHNRYFITEKELQCRFLYGTDYYMNLVYLNDMKDYCDNFVNVFTNEEFDKISITNPRKFLNLPDEEN
ncbi:MAG: amidohydrolase family protein [Paludibacteraceae bacterium]|nr:amidohydrolase family protein [Paludibacteraceae bacterium]MBP5137137.1 amidohydrolase family protein [Paludibacteraceae bacterium]